MPHSIRRGENEKDTKGQRRDVLLELDALVHSEQGIVLATHASKKLAVIDAGPATPDDGGGAVAFEHDSEI